MSSEYPRPCKCGSRDLKPMWNSATGEQWVACDACGNYSKPLKGKSRKELIAQWDAENSRHKKAGRLVKKSKRKKK